MRFLLCPAHHTLWGYSPQGSTSSPRTRSRRAELLAFERLQPEHRAAGGPCSPPLALEHALRDRDLLLACGEMRGRGERTPSVGDPGLRQELEAADVAVAGVRAPVTTRLAGREAVPDTR